MSRKAFPSAGLTVEGRKRGRVKDIGPRREYIANRPALDLAVPVAINVVNWLKCNRCGYDAKDRHDLCEHKERHYGE